MLANIRIGTKQSSFQSGTIGAGWLWKMVEDKTGEKSEWTTDNPLTSVSVNQGNTYSVCGARVDPKNELLGGQVCTQFTAEIKQVVIDTAESITVEVVE